MKKLILFIAILLTNFAIAQAPQGFNYQAIVRNATGQLIINQSVTVKFNLIQGLVTNAPIYTEQHVVTTDALGAINVVIGQGTAATGNFDQIVWSQGSAYLGIEVNTGNGFISLGTTQLLSVPYALYAETSGSSNIVAYKTLPVNGTELNGYILPTNEDLVDGGFVYSTTNNLPTIQNSQATTIDLASTSLVGRVQLWIPNILPNQVYYCRVFAKNVNNQYFYGNVVTFTSPAATLTIED